ncbi:MAG TPA: thioredoxin family protein [Candidatus Cloacimonadota bacterium]|nr:thioredoxin family protein [Candidatus Cloacimonadota bacterium]HPT70674.1 thioredoxin family protein [Candidatus Cloacimonadota bacterium]
MIIKILGGGCSKCKKLEENVRKALEQSGKKAQIEKVMDIKSIMAYGVMTTPALVIDEKVKSTGKILNPVEIIKLISS